jgi:ApbE superfamily uncharacterized protein (UPF0280 family)
MKGLCEEKTYRNWVRADGLVTFRIREKETDILVSAGSDLRKEALEAAVRYRRQIENYVSRREEFGTSLCPLKSEPDAPPIVRDMVIGSRKAGVGPMASVAGAIAQYVGRELSSMSDEVIVENGGDIFLKILRRRAVAVYAGDSIFAGRIAFEVEPDDTPLGICTSSGTIGHSLSFGKADAVVICSSSAVLADAVATASCNRVKGVSDVKDALDFARSIDGVSGVIIVFGDKLGVWGCIKLRQ